MKLIDSEAFETDVRKRYCKGCDNSNGIWCRACWVDDMLGEIEEAPAIEAKPIVHGRNLSANTPSQFECSVCGCEDWDTYTCDVDVYKYCPKCGAIMDEVIV